MIHDNISVPDPILDDREYDSLEKLTERYEKMTKTGFLERAGGQIAKMVPDGIKDAVNGFAEGLSEHDIYLQALDIMGQGFKVIENQAARLTVDPEAVVVRLNSRIGDVSITSLNEICLIRGYLVAEASGASNSQHLVLALAEGGGTGLLGFSGIPFNLVLSTFLYYRAVQCVAVSYGYDVKADPAELVIASDVFANALNPGRGGVSNEVAKIMSIGAAAGVKAAARKGWAEMVKQGGPALIIAQMRALAHVSAQKALENAGKNGLENSIFREVFKQVGERLTLKAVQRAVPIVSAGIGALMDTAQMNTVLQYADIFYQKRFLLEKEERINALIGNHQNNA